MNETEKLRTTHQPHSIPSLMSAMHITLWSVSLSAGRHFSGVSPWVWKCVAWLPQKPGTLTNARVWFSFHTMSCSGQPSDQNGTYEPNGSIWKNKTRIISVFSCFQSNILLRTVVEGEIDGSHKTSSPPVVWNYGGYKWPKLALQTDTYHYNGGLTFCPFVTQALSAFHKNLGFHFSRSKESSH